MQQSFELNGSRNESLASDRLQKAIDRNRAKQARRQGRTQERPQGSSAYKAPPASPSFASSSSSSRSAASSTTRTRSQGLKKRTTSISSERQSVGRLGEVEFVDSPRKRRGGSPAPVSYATKTTPASRAKKRPVSTSATAKKLSATSIKRPPAPEANISPTMMKWMGRIAWGFAVLLVLRLIFSQAGVLDFYSERDSYEGRKADLQKLKETNEHLREEIRRIQTDGPYQRKLVRDHLGHIARDEFLVMFSRVRK